MYVLIMYMHARLRTHSRAHTHACGHDTVTRHPDRFEPCSQGHAAGVATLAVGIPESHFSRPGSPFHEKRQEVPLPLYNRPGVAPVNACQRIRARRFKHLDKHMYILARTFAPHTYARTHARTHARPPARTQCMHTPPRIQSKRRESAKFVMNHPEFCSESSRYQVNAIVRRGVNDACLAIGRGKRPCYLDCPVPYDEASGHWEPDGM